MTNATMALAELAEKGADIDVLRQMVQFVDHVANLLGAQLGAEDFETLPAGTEFFNNPA